MAFNKHGPGARLYDDQRTNKACRRFFRSNKEQMQWAFDGRAGSDMNDRAIAHQRGIERHGDITGRRKFAQVRGDRCVVVGERVAERNDRKT